MECAVVGVVEGPIEGVVVGRRVEGEAGTSIEVEIG